jgi:hypothetical protein
MLPIAQQPLVPAVDRVTQDEPAASSAFATPATSLRALGADLQACFEKPDSVSIGDVAALVERLQGELRFVAGVALQSRPNAPTSDDDFAWLFGDDATRELTASDVGLLETALRPD